MSVTRISKVSQNQSKPKKVKPKKASVNKEVKDRGKHKIALTLGALAGVGAASILMLSKINKGQLNISEFQKLKDISFEKGIATLKKNGEKYSGTIVDTLKNGDKITLEYADGIIKSSAREGSLNMKKVFNYENSKLSRVITNFADGLRREYVVKSDGGRIIKNGVVVKEYFNHQKSIVVNNFDNEFGILTNTTVLDKETKNLTKIKREASKHAAEIREEGSNAIERFQNGECKKAVLSDGTVIEYNLRGDIINATSAKRRRLNVSEKRSMDNRRITIIKYPNGSKKGFIQNSLIFDDKAKGSYLEYYTNGQLKSDPTSLYRGNGTVISSKTNYGSTIKYAEDGFSKLNEKFDDGSQVSYIL